MGSLKSVQLQVVSVLLLLITISFSGSVRARANDRVNPLRFGEDRKSWQLTLNFSRYLDKLTVHSRDKTGLWKKKKAIDGTSWSLRSSVELNERIGFRGGFSYRTDSIKTEATNLWTGGRETSEETSSQFGGATFKIKVSIWENSEIKSHFLVPVLGGSPEVGLVWSKDPVMVLPELSITDEGFDINTGVSFVANSKIAITGRISFSQEENRSTVGLGGGLVYRKGEYDGVRVSASLRRGDTTQVSLEVGLSYGQERT
ncbi:MAG: hypothetical protein V5A81_07900 [Candidatus Bipolaricaulota bacterium]|nr:hypothetical protein [Candidatus Bipolaricaulota bacterium]MBS3792250.1 hypothetical protein [Candidatus Bipolaricaulota bacterium]